jgi:membrane fusion protein, heavy metal efflux system
MKYIFFVCLCAYFVSCRNSDTGSAHIISKNDSDSIISTNSNNVTDKLKTAKIEKQIYRKKLITSGVVKAIPNSYAEIASPFSGRIIKSHVTLGQRVDVGSPIFEISSPEFFDAGKNYYKSKQEMELAGKNLQRQKDLFSNGVGTQKDLDEAEVTYNLATRDFENSVASLKVYHVDPETLVLGQPLVVRSPIAGEVVESRIVLGQYLKEDAGSVAIVTELSNVWVIGHLKEKDISLVHKNDPVEIRLTGLPGVIIGGTVFHLGEILDEETRSVQVYILCKNSERQMRPGMFVSTQYSETNEDAILIPTSSLFQMKESSYVFLAVGKNMFVRRKVDIDISDSNRVFVKSGLRQGDEIVVDGGSLLLDLKN